MLTREEIISSFKKVDFPSKILESTEEVKNIIFYSESTEPSSKKEKDTKFLSQSYVLPWRLVQQKNFNDASKNNTFNRGSNFVPKEELIDIKIENFKLIYDKYSIPLAIGLIYIKNNYGGNNGPFNLNQLQNMYKSKKIDSTFEFRPIDIFQFKDCDIYAFKSIKIINEIKWVDLIIDSSLVNYIKPSNNKIEPSKIEKVELITPKEKIEVRMEDKKLEQAKEKKEDKKEEKKIEIKENVEEKKDEKKEEKKEEKKDNIIKKQEEKWEVVQKKKNKSNKEKEIEEEDKEIIGLKPKNSKEGKKAKKKKKQMEDVDFELGFKIK